MKIILRTSGSASTVPKQKTILHNPEMVKFSPASLFWFWGILYFPSHSADPCKAAHCHSATHLNPAAGFTHCFDPPLQACQLRSGTDANSSGQKPTAASIYSCCQCQSQGCSDVLKTCNVVPKNSKVQGAGRRACKEDHGLQLCGESLVMRGSSG